jgi:hypothetical protein
LVRNVGKKRNVVAVWIGLPLITLGIYQLVWWYKINREMRDFDQRISVNPARAVLALIPGGFILIPPFVSVFNTGKRIRQAQESAGLAPTCSPGLGILLGFIFGLHSLYYQGQLNMVWSAAERNAPAGVPTPPAYS